MKIYRITSPNHDKCYVGKTIQPLAKRFAEHKAKANWVKGSFSSREIINAGNPSIHLIEETDDPTREIFWIRNLDSVNIKRTCGEEERKQKKKIDDKIRYEKKKLL